MHFYAYYQLVEAKTIVCSFNIFRSIDSAGNYPTKFGIMASLDLITAKDLIKYVRSKNHGDFMRSIERWICSNKLAGIFNDLRSTRKVGKLCTKLLRTRKLSFCLKLSFIDWTTASHECCIFNLTPIIPVIGMFTSPWQGDCVNVNVKFNPRLRPSRPFRCETYHNLIVLLPKRRWLSKLINVPNLLRIDVCHVLMKNFRKLIKTNYKKNNTKISRII